MDDKAPLCVHFLDKEDLNLSCLSNVHDPQELLVNQVYKVAHTLDSSKLSRCNYHVKQNVCILCLRYLIFLLLLS